MTVSDLALCNLQLAIYAIKHFGCTSRTGAAFDALFWGITPTSIADLAYQRKQEEYDAKETPTLPKLTLDGSRVAKSFEALDELLGRFRGISGVPLSYVVRNERAVKPSREDPRFNAPQSTYSSYDEEMIARAPITSNPFMPVLHQAEGVGPFHIHFTIDMKKVWQILYDLFHDAPIWVHVRMTKQTKNGRTCYRALHHQLLGGTRGPALGMQITQQLRQVVYEGDRKGWNFDKYVAAHVEAHNNVEALRQYGYTGLPGLKKVDLFLRGIRVPEFDTCRNQLLTDPTIMSDFGRVKDHFIAFAHQKAAIAPPRAATRQVSAVSGAGRGRGGAGRGQDRGRGAGRGRGPRDPDARRLGLADQRDVDSCVVENRDYSKAEYDQLTRAQRQKLWQMRYPDRAPGTGPSRAGGRGSDRSATGYYGPSHASTASASAPSTATRGVSAIVGDSSSNDSRSLFSDDSEMTAQGSNGSNRENPNLRQSSAAKRTKNN